MTKAAMKKTASRTAPAAAPKKKYIRRNMIQWKCPVPRCKGKAAPVFHMVCAKHKDVPKSKIKQYRKARSAKAAR